MENQDIINVGLYGGKPLFGGREKPLGASVIKCDKYDKCSFYQENSCFNVRGFGGSCKHGSVSNHKGYTSRAMKYRDFRDKWQDHKEYNRLNYPNKKVGKIENEVVLSLSYINIKYDKETNKWTFNDPGFFSGGIVYINEETFDSSFINRICKAQPQAIMGGTIGSYQKEEVPLFLAHLKEVLPDKYSKFVKDYPEFDTEIDHRGRKAYIHTILPSTVEVKRSGHREPVEQWEWDGEYLTLLSDKRLLLAINSNYSLDTLIIKPNEKMTVEITDNIQVGENTKFVD